MFIRRKKLIVSVAFILLLIIAITYYLTSYQENLNRNVPTTVTFNSNITKPEDVAYRFWSDYMDQYKDSSVGSWQQLLDARYETFQLLAGDEKEFAVAVTFWIQPKLGMWSKQNNWGKLRKDGTIHNIQWTFRIKKIAENQYTLLKIEPTSNAIAGLMPVKDTYQKEAGIQVPDQNSRYRLENGTLEVTYTNGETWRKVPIQIEELFQGAYSGSKSELMEGSYVIKRERTTFVAGGKVDYETWQQEPVRIISSTYEGRTWMEAQISDFVPGIRLRQLGFTSENHGYLILTGDKTMSAEVHTVYLTNDGGKSWRKVNSVQDHYRLVASAGFINEQVGFISFAPIYENGVERPSLYRTGDGGQTWTEVAIPIPIEYEGIFTTTQTPTFDGSQGTLLVNQGPNGDYQGGKVLARLTSVDSGATWFFSNLVDPNHSINE